MTEVRWYRAAEALRSAIAHLADHRRLGPTFTKCGKAIGAEIIGGVGEAYEACRSCQYESDQEFLRMKEGFEAESKVKANAEAIEKLKATAAPTIVIRCHIDNPIEIVSKPKGVRVEVVRMGDDGEGLLCDRQLMPGAECSVKATHSHRYFYEETAIPEVPKP